MKPRITLPDELRGRPFTIARGRAAELSQKRLRGADLDSPFRGVRAPAAGEAGAEALFRRAVEAAAAIVSPPFAFSHLTAARLLDLPLPRDWTATEDLHVMVPNGRAGCRLRGVARHRGLESRQVYTVADGIDVTDPCATWADLGGLLSPDDLIVAGDAVVGHGRPRTADDLAAAVRPGMRHRGRLLTALREIRPGSASPMESRVRLLLTRAGLPQPRLNIDLTAPDGTWLACVDLYWPTARLVVEFDGDVHRVTRGQWQHDLRRRRRLVEAGYEVVVLTGDDLTRYAAHTVSLVARHLAG